MGVIHEAGHLLMSRTFWNSSQDGNNIHAWTESLPNNGHPYVQMDEMVNCRFGHNIICHLDIVLETLLYDSVPQEQSAQLQQMTDHPEWFNGNGLNNPVILSLLPLAQYISEPSKTFVHMKCDIDFHPLYPFQQWRNGKVWDHYVKDSMDLESFKEMVFRDPIICGFGKRFFELVGIIDDELEIQGHMSEAAIDCNQDELCKLFRIPALKRDEFLSFWKSGLYR